MSSTSSSASSRAVPVPVAEGAMDTDAFCWGRRFVTSTRALHAAMVAMHAHSDGLMFDNISNEYQVVFRVGDSVGENCTFEVTIFTDSEIKLEKVLRNEIMGYFEDDDATYVVDSVVVGNMQQLAHTDASVEKAMRLINDVWSWRVCVCGHMLCKHGDRCLRCILTDSEEDLQFVTAPCLVCHDPCGKRFSKCMQCCGARMHTRCVQRWTALNETCPHCRAPLLEMSTTTTL